MNKKIFNIIFISTILFLLGLLSYNIYKLNNYRNSIKDLKENILNTDLEDANENNDNNDLYEPIDDSDSSIDKYNYTEQISSYLDYELDVVNFAVLDNYINNSNDIYEELYLNMCDYLNDKFDTGLSAYIDESSIEITNDSLKFSLLDVDTRNVLMEIDFTIPKKYSTNDYLVTITNLNVLKPYFSNSNEWDILANYSIKESIISIINKDTTCFIDTNTLKYAGKKLNFNVVDSTTKKLIKTVSIDLP